MANYFIYGNVNSLTYGVMISGSGTFNKPQRRVEKITIPGRNGDVFVADNGFENVTVSYPAFIARGFEHKYHEFIEAMLSQEGYCKLEDTYDINHYRMGIFQAPEEAEVGTLNRTGKFTLEFDCQPQRWLKTLSEFETVWTQGDPLLSIHCVNPTKYIAQPIIRVYGYGGIWLYATDNVGYMNITMDISDYSQEYSGYDHVDIDSEIEECYYGGVSLNSFVEMTQSGALARSLFPALLPGDTHISIPEVASQTTIDRIDIKTRFWTI